MLMIPLTTYQSLITNERILKSIVVLYCDDKNGVEYSLEVLTAGRLTRHVRHVHTLVETSVLRVQNKSPFITIAKCNKTLSCLY